VPSLDYALLCDYVRAEAGLAHVIAAGIDTIWKEEVPAGQNVGLLIRVAFARSECGRPHRLEVIFQDEDGARLAQMEAAVQPAWVEGLPPSWSVGVVVAMNVGLPLPRFGLYALEILVNDSLVKTIPLRVIRREQPSARE